ncbi:MAG: hypothetical protein SPI12_00025 [Actinomycetaceae bacterium]|nr:hypothetical protein [Actinomycetaceae bacterium]MDY6082242.1 hypothetical protein [Actinomycetaceae bacterium]
MHKKLERSVRVVITGAVGDYGRTIVAQLKGHPLMTPAVLVDPNVGGLTEMLSDLGLESDVFALAGSREDAERLVREDRIALVYSESLIPWTATDVLVEATGKISVGVMYARSAMQAHNHVVMVSKEVDSACGAALSEEAVAHGVNYVLADGDQPGNLMRLTAWIDALGLDIVAVGKAGEFDLVFNPSTQSLYYRGAEYAAPGMADLLELPENHTASHVYARAAVVPDLKRAVAADYCEMAAVAQRLGYGADTETMHYPIARPAELADIYALRKDGGILASSSVVDVFTPLRLPGEASFAGGVFAIVRTGDPVTWKILGDKGHVVSRDGKYACIYWPFHLMGVETPLAILRAVQEPHTQAFRPSLMMAARASRDLEAGMNFSVQGHHHEIEGTFPVLTAVDDSASVCPYYLLDGARLRVNVTKGHMIRVDDVEYPDLRVESMHR